MPIMNIIKSPQSGAVKIGPAEPAPMPMIYSHYPLPLLVL